MVIVAAPSRATAIKLWQRDGRTFDVLTCSALADRTVAAIAPNAVVHTVAPAPRFEVADQAALHFEDTSPLPISAPGTPPTVAIELDADFFLGLWNGGLVLRPPQSQPPDGRRHRPPPVRST